MVARITTPHSMRRALSYNELKMKLGQAECIDAGNYLAEAQHLNFYEKLERFQSLTQLNERTKRNTLHISLNFDPKENFEKEKLRELAKVYLEKIGFGNQPYLVYKHLDAGHPHIHILTTNIQPDGRAISMHNLGRNQSEEARKSMELEYNLVRAQRLKLQQKQEITKEFREVHAQRMQYGKYETKQSLTNVLNHVVNQYKYTSLPELNAVLRLYNVLADRGAEGSRIHEKRGLVYRVLDQNGNKIGVPIKASAIYFKPTLNNLEVKFKENESLRLQHKQHLSASIRWNLQKSDMNLTKFSRCLQKDGIAVCVRQNAEGVIYGMTYIDHTTRCVFNGSDLGKEYSAKAVLEKCSLSQEFRQEHRLSQELKQEFKPQKPNETSEEQQHSQHQHHKQRMQDNPLEELIRPIEEKNEIPWRLIKKKKQSQRKSLSQGLR